MTTKEIIALAAEHGAKAALEHLDKLQKQKQSEITDRRLRNVKLLLRNYRMLKAHCENAVFEAECDESALDILEDMMVGRDSSVIVDSIKRSAARTAVIVRHVDVMLGLFQAYCANSTQEDMRRWRVIEALYIREDKRTVAEIAEAEGVVERTVYKDVDVAAERLAALMFGIDGLDKKGTK